MGYSFQYPFMPLLSGCLRGINSDSEKTSKVVTLIFAQSIRLAEVFAEDGSKYNDNPGFPLEIT